MRLSERFGLLLEANPDELAFIIARPEIELIIGQVARMEDAMKSVCDVIVTHRKTKTRVNLKWIENKLMKALEE